MRSESIAILQVIVATMLFATQDSITKILTADYPITQVVGVRMIGFLVFAGIYCHLRIGLINTLRSSRPFLQLFRSMLWALEIMVYALALKQIGNAEAAAIFASFPLLVTLLAVPMLGETLGWRRLSSVGIGLIGAWLVINPDGDGYSAGAWTAFAAAVMFALYQVVTRMLSSSERFESSVFYMALAGVVCTQALGLNDQWLRPTASGALMMAVLTVTGVIGHMLLVNALEKATASALQPFNFLILVWAMPISWIVFDTLPGAQSLLGATLIVGAGLFVWWREKQLNRQSGEF